MLPVATGYKCADGRYVRVTWLEGRQLEVFASRYGKYAEWTDDGLLGEAGGVVGRFVADPEKAERLRAGIALIFLAKTADEWERELNPDCDCVAIQTSQEWLLYDAQAQANDGVIILDDPDLGLTHQTGYPITFSKTPMQAQGPRRTLDADHHDLATLLDRRPPRPIMTASGARELTSALEGFKAIDLTVLLAGPGACRVLGEFGAEIVHIGNPTWRGMDGFHYQVHSGKRTTVLNLKTDEGRELVWKLIADADVISTNFSQTVAARLGIDEETVRKQKPGIVYSRISAHGMFGRRKEFRGHEEVGQAVTGAMVRHGQDQNEPEMQPFAINDMGTGWVVSFGIMVALYHRIGTGVGQFLGGSLAQTCALWQTPFMVAHKNKDWSGEPGGVHNLGPGTLSRLYEGSDGRWFFLDVPPRAVAEVSDIDGLDRIDFGGEDLATMLERAFAAKPASHWVHVLTNAGFGAALHSTIPQAMADPWARSHGVSIDVEFPHAGRGTIVGPPPRLSATPMRPGKPVPPPGWDGAEVVEELDAGRLEHYIAAGALILPPDHPQWRPIREPDVAGHR